MTTLKDKQTEIEREIGELMDKGNQHGDGKILADLDNKLNPIEIIALDDNLHVGRLKAKLKGLQEGAKLREEEILKIMEDLEGSQAEVVWFELKQRINQLKGEK